MHYHLFKNAGSSVDEILKQSFGDSWKTFDKDRAEAKILPLEMAVFINHNAHARAISSHQVMPPLPQGDFEVFPLVFLRHPLDRVRSAYLFEWKKQLGLSAPKGSFADYVREKLESGSRGPIVNYQVYQLSNLAHEGDKPQHDKDLRERLTRAKEFLVGLPFFGLVEHYHESLVRLHFYLKYHFPELKVINHQINTSQDTSKQLEDKLMETRQELGEALYGELVDRNLQDLELYKFACTHFFSVVQRAN